MRHRVRAALAASLFAASLLTLTGVQTPVEGQRSSAPLTLGSADARMSWHFTVPAAAASQVTLILFNPTGIEAHVWIRAGSAQEVRLWSATVNRGSIRTVPLPTARAEESVALRADRNIIASSFVNRPHFTYYAFGEPGTGKRAPNTMPMPAQQWRFPPLSTTPGAVILTLSNPNQEAVQATVRIVGTRVRLQVPIPARASEEVSLSLTAQTNAIKALLVTASGAIIPERWTLGRSGTGTSYGMPVGGSSSFAPQPALTQTRTSVAYATPTSAIAGRSAILPPAAHHPAATLETDLKRAERLDGFSGAVLISRQGHVVLEKGYGFADRTHHVPIQPTTAFPIRGLTSMFTAVGIMQLYDRHRLSIADPMCRYLPGCPQPLRPITIEQLLTNTSGLPTPRLDVTKPFGEAELMAAFSSAPPVFTPGSQWKASDTGYVLLGFIIERVSGLPYRRYIHDHILTPLGMTQSGFALDSRHPALALGYHGTAEVTRSAGPGYDPAWGMYSTVTDLSTFDLALDRYTLLSQGATRAMVSRHVTFAGGGGYGYDWTTGTFHGQRFASTNAGGSPGYVGVNVRLLGDHADIIVLGNQDRTSLASLAITLGNALLNTR